MLSPDELREALHDAEKASACCGRFCRIVGEYSDDNRYRLSHNGIGAKDTDSQVVHATPVLGKTKEALVPHLAEWITKLHKGERVDLNAMETRGPAMAGWPWIVGESASPAGFTFGLRLVTKDTGADPWRWQWTDGTTP